MSHAIERDADGRYLMAYSGLTPWHGLGKKILPDLTPEQMLKEAGLDWEVEKVPAFIEYNGEKILTGQEALMRKSDGKFLSNVSADWEPNQNSTAFEFFEEFVMEGGMEMHTAGSLNEGRMVWALAKVKDSFTVFGKDKVDSYLLFSNPHQYGKSIDIRFTPIRVVCNNTLTLSLSGKTDLMVRLNHRHPFDATKVKETLGMAQQKLGTYKEMAQFLGSKRYTEDTLNEFLSKVFPSNSKSKLEAKKLSRPAQIAHDIVETSPGNEFAPGTYWQAFNAATYGIDHLFGHSDNNRLYSSWYGVNRKKKLDALELACEMADAA